MTQEEISRVYEIAGRLAECEHVLHGIVEVFHGSHGDAQQSSLVRKLADQLHDVAETMEGRNT